MFFCFFSAATLAEVQDHRPRCRITGAVSKTGDLCGKHTRPAVVAARGPNPSRGRATPSWTASCGCSDRLDVRPLCGDQEVPMVQSMVMAQSIVLAGTCQATRYMEHMTSTCRSLLSLVFLSQVHLESWSPSIFAAELRRH